MGDVATADPGTCGTAEDAGALEQMWHLDLHHFCNEERGTKNLLNHLKPVPSQHSAHPESLGLCRTEPGSRLWNHYRPISTTWLMSTLKRVTGEFMWGSSHSWESLPQGRENAPWRWPREIPQKWRPRKKYSYTMLYNAIQYHCTPSIIRVSNAARVPQDWIRNPPEIQYIKPYKTWAKHLDYSWTHSDLSKNGEQSQEPSRTYISLDWLVLCSV